MSSLAAAATLKKIRIAKREGSRELVLFGMGLSSLPPEISELSDLKELQLGNNKFSEFPKEILSLKNLAILDLSGNPISEVPSDIKSLEKLQLLNITGLKLHSLPEEFCELSELMDLFAGYNMLKSLPKGFSKLSKLSGLYLHNNEFTSFPQELANYQSLKNLTLGSKISKLPKRISRFKSLKRLCLTDNNLTLLPAEIGEMNSLRHLELSINKLKEIPTEISNLKNLIELSLADNPLPASLLSAERDGVKTLLSQIESLSDPRNVEMLYEAKLMITGEGKVGKSCLRMALDGSIDLSRDQNNSTTWGVDCGTLYIQDPELSTKEIQFNYWDFGGQKVYRITHQFFYSDQGLYLLVWDPRLGEEQCLIKDWLVRIAARTAGEAKVIIVATHCEVDGGNYSSEVDLSQFELNLRNLVVEQVNVDSFTGKNIELLKSVMVKHVKGMPGIESPINRDWDKARKAALDPKNLAPWMNYSEFNKICEKFGIYDRDAVQSIAATFLHRLGRGVWYGMSWDQDAYLRDTIVRDPSWLAMAFMEIVQHEATKVSGGMLNHSDLSDVWIDHGREADGWRVYDLNDHHRLMRMMRAQGVALPTKASNGERSLIPQLVPLDAPDLPWSDPNELKSGSRILRMRTRIGPILDGFMSHLIAALEPYHYYNDDQQGTFWQNGMFLRDTEGRFKNDALINLKKEINYLELNVSVTGEEPGILLQQIDAAISECLKFWPGADRSDNVYCPHVVNSKLCSGDFKLENIHRWLKRNQDNTICHECDKVSTPSDLIYGLRNRNELPSKSDLLIHYLAFKEQRPAPRSVIILPAKASWKDIKSWEVLGRVRMKAQLRSELSGALVAEKEFTSSPGIFKYIGPVAKLGSLFFTAVPLPLELSPDLADSFSELGDALEKLSDQMPEGEVRYDVDHESEERNASLIAAFLEAIDLSPRLNGMDLERAPDGRWYWMNSQEVKQYRPIQASL